MGPGVLAFGGIPTRPMTLDGPLGGPYVWLLLAFAVFALGTLAWSALGSWHERLTAEVVRCPTTHEEARLLVRRMRDGRVIGVQTCSLMSPPTHVTCARGCLAQVRA